MAKAPVAGAAKTRLAREIGAAAATRFARQATAALLQRVARDPRWQTILAVSPDAAVASRCWPRGIARMGQGRGDLGRRMQRIMQRMPPGPVVIVGTDVPGITPALIAAAFRRLGRHDAVFGPAADGGYWLVGMRRRPRLLHAFRPRALVERARARRYAGEPRGPRRRLRRDAQRCRRCARLRMRPRGPLRLRDGPGFRLSH